MADGTARASTGAAMRGVAVTGGADHLAGAVGVVIGNGAHAMTTAATTAGAGVIDAANGVAESETVGAARAMATRAAGAAAAVTRTAMTVGTAITAVGAATATVAEIMVAITTATRMFGG